MNLDNLHYVTTCWKPTPFEQDEYTAKNVRYMTQPPPPPSEGWRNLGRIGWRVTRAANAIPALQRTRKVLGNRLVALVDARMADDALTAPTYKALMGGQFGAESVRLEEPGYWRPKWAALLEAGRRVGWPLLWFDFFDAEVTGFFTDEEKQFLDQRPIVVEFGTYLNPGPPLHYSDGRNSRRRIRNVLPGVVLLPDDHLTKQALALPVDNDQCGLGLVMEREFGIYQDTPEEKIKSFSSQGLFRLPTVGRTGLRHRRDALPPPPPSRFPGRIVHDNASNV